MPLRALLASLVWFVLFTAFAAQAATDQLDTLVTRLGKQQLTRFTFAQEKSIKALKRPIISEGLMLFERDRGIIWQTMKPRPSLFVITPTGISRREGNETVTSLESRDNPAVEGFTKVFLSLFRGDVSDLKQMFEVALSGDPSATDWSLKLSPRDDRVGHFLKELRFSGDDVIRRVELDEANGDHAKIELTPKVGTPLTAEESETFKH